MKFQVVGVRVVSGTKNNKPWSFQSVDGLLTTDQGVVMTGEVILNTDVPKPEIGKSYVPVVEPSKFNGRIEFRVVGFAPQKI